MICRILLRIAEPIKEKTAVKISPAAADASMMSRTFPYPILTAASPARIVLANGKSERENARSCSTNTGKIATLSTVVIISIISLIVL